MPATFTDDQLAQLVDDIDEGFTTEPPLLSSKGRALARWRRRHKDSPSSSTTSEREPQWRRTHKRSQRGYRGPGGGAMDTVKPPLEWQATTAHVCGLNPWMVGAASPNIGTPVGAHLTTGEPATCDVLAWFAAGLISNPSAFVLSLPGLGKSTLIRKMVLGAIAQGQCPLIAGDMKGEYVELIRANGGQVITLGHGKGHLNPLAAGSLGSTIPLLEAHEQQLIAAGRGGLIDETRELVHSRQVLMTATLIELIRQEPVADYEHALLSSALRELREGGQFDFENPPLVRDLADQISAGSDRLQKIAAAASREEYLVATIALRRSMAALLDGPLGEIFADHTSTPLDLSAPGIVIDVSSLTRGDKTLKAAVMLACWSDAYGSMEAAHLLAAAKLAPQRYFLAVLDELWQVLGAGAGMVQRIDELTRLNRSDGTGLLQITHTGRDLETLPTEADIKTALGFIERAGMVICGGLPAGELARLEDVLQYSVAEQAMITSWSRGAPLRRRHRGARQKPAGIGKFMIKISKDSAAGIPIQTLLTPTEIELRLHDTNARFDELIAQQER
ncbi:ATP/GTP-binding protein [Nocardia suismassiliense]|uniref:ATP/GTP-binding protein n=1 Tax=Nocardia suismassiliense TaxID=2077092 RepID=UPI001F257F95|nr:ATP/GTP-binding protein [Nocardia suismassiliense]